MTLNNRQLRLKNMIDTGNVPSVVDATGIWDKDESKIPFHWGDIEKIGYGSTCRVFDRNGEKIDVIRRYTGPGRINLQCFGEMGAGMDNEQI